MNYFVLVATPALIHTVGPKFELLHGFEWMKCQVPGKSLLALRGTAWCPKGEYKW